MEEDMDTSDDDFSEDSCLILMRIYPPKVELNPPPKKKYEYLYRGMRKKTTFYLNHDLKAG